jgi:hypothetical protein
MPDIPPMDNGTSKGISGINPVGTMTPETDEDLLIRIHSGDEDAFVSIYRFIQCAIFSFGLIICVL